MGEQAVSGATRSGRDGVSVVLRGGPTFHSSRSRSERRYAQAGAPKNLPQPTKQKKVQKHKAVRRRLFSLSTQLNNVSALFQRGVKQGGTASVTTNTTRRNRFLSMDRIPRIAVYDEGRSTLISTFDEIPSIAFSIAGRI